VRQNASPQVKASGYDIENGNLQQPEEEVERIRGKCRFQNFVAVSISKWRLMADPPQRLEIY
jgi:hypothetical protein